jgi:hypothetical protein
MEHFIYQLEIFFLIFSILYVLKYALKAINVIRLQEGKIDNDTVDLILLGSSLSYIITSIIAGL